MLRPYPGHDLGDGKCILNYHIQARRIVENAFGILAARWRIYQRRIQLHPKNVDKVIKVHVLSTITYRTPLVIQKAAPIAKVSEYREEVSASGTLESLRPTGNRGSQEAVNIRDKFNTYFNSKGGEVPWQRNACFGNAR